MKKVLLKCLILGVCIGAVESELSIKGDEVEPVVEGSELIALDDELQPDSRGGLTWNM